MPEVQNETVNDIVMKVGGDISANVTDSTSTEPIVSGLKTIQI